MEDRKTGFCLGDRYDVEGRRLPNRAPRKVYRSRCGLEQTELLGIREGISVGYGDDYAANLEGQYLPLTGLADGEYVLAHRVNERPPDPRDPRTATTPPRSSSRLRWRVGVPYVRILARCPGRADCALTRGSGTGPS